MEENKKYIKVERHKWPDEVAAEKTKVKNRLIVIIGCLICFSLGFGLRSLSNVNEKATTEQVVSNNDKFTQVYKVMSNEWYFGKDIKDLDSFLMENAIKGLTTNDYDAHTNYLDKEQSASFMSKLEGTFIGIGIVYSQMNDSTIISRVYSNSPAKEADIKPGDIITKVNGISVEGKSLDEIAKLTLGEEGTALTMELIRDNKTIKKELVRKNISTTAFGYIKDGVGILEISSFSEKTDKEVEVYLKEFKESDVKRIIIDLRDNTGGYVTTAVNMASLFMESGKVILKEEAKDNKVIEYKAKESTTYLYDKIVMLVNEKTASAAEVLTACLNEQIGALIVGTNTYGKGTVQLPKVLKDGSYLKYTVAEWLTPNGEKINKVGIKPNVKVKEDKAVSNEMSTSKKSYKVDSVGNSVKDTQIYLRFIGYTIDRTDGYYSNATLEAVNKYQQDNNLEVNGVINIDLNTQIFAKAQKKWFEEKDKLDLQLIKAMEVVNGK